MTHSTPLTFFQPPRPGTLPRNSSRASRALPPLYTIPTRPFSSSRALPYFPIVLSPFPLCRLPLPFPADHPSFARHSHPRRRGHRRTERAAASKLILNAEVGHLVYFFINSVEWAIRLPHRIRVFLIKGRTSHSSSFIPPRRPPCFFFSHVSLHFARARER